MRRRQSDRQLNPHQGVAVPSHRFDLIGNGKERQNEKAFILRLIPPIGNTPVGQRIVLPLICQAVRSEPRRVALDQSGCEWLRMNGFDLFVSMVDCN